MVDSVTISTQIRFPLDNGEMAIFRGDYAAFTSHEALDMSVLGRDILDMFAVIVDRAADVVAIIRERHGYAISVAT